MNPNITTIIGTIACEPFTVSERGGRRRRAGFQVDVRRRWWVHFEQTDCGMLELHADVVALALSDEPRVDDESETAA